MEVVATRSNPRIGGTGDRAGVAGGAQRTVHFSFSAEYIPHELRAAAPPTVRTAKNRRGEGFGSSRNGRRAPPLDGDRRARSWSKRDRAAGQQGRRCSGAGLLR